MSPNAHTAAPARKRLTPEARRAQLVATTRQLIVSEGLAAVSMGRVAKESGVTKPVVYAHFPNRGALILAVASEMWSWYDEVGRERVASVDDFNLKLEAYVSAVFDVISASWELFKALWDEDTDEPLVEQARLERQDRVEQHWADIYRDALGVSPGVARFSAAVIRGAIQSGAAHWLRNPDVPIEESKRLCTRLVRGALDELAHERVSASR